MPRACHLRAFYLASILLRPRNDGGMTGDDWCHRCIESDGFLKKLITYTATPFEHRWLSRWRHGICLDNMYRLIRTITIGGKATLRYMLDIIWHRRCWLRFHRKAIRRKIFAASLERKKFLVRQQVFSNRATKCCCNGRLEKYLQKEEKVPKEYLRGTSGLPQGFL